MAAKEVRKVFDWIGLHLLEVMDWRIGGLELTDWIDGVIMSNKLTKPCTLLYSTTNGLIEWFNFRIAG